LETALGFLTVARRT